MVPTNKQPHLHYLSAGQTIRNSKSALCTLIASRISTHNYLNDVHSNSLPGTKTDVNVYSIDTEEVMVIGEGSLCYRDFSKELSKKIVTQSNAERENSSKASKRALKN